MPRRSANQGVAWKLLILLLLKPLQALLRERVIYAPLYPNNWWAIHHISVSYLSIISHFVSYVVLLKLISVLPLLFFCCSLIFYPPWPSAPFSRNFNKKISVDQQSLVKQSCINFSQNQLRNNRPTASSLWEQGNHKSS